MVIVYITLSEYVNTLCGQADSMVCPLVSLARSLLIAWAAVLMTERCRIAVQGPPGTGKTRTLLALLEVLSRISGEPGRPNAMGPILACADTNAATDNLVEGLVERGIDVTRLGQPAKVSP